MNDANATVVIALLRNIVSLLERIVYVVERWSVKGGM